MKEILDSILRHYGEPLQILRETGEQEAVRAFLQPVTNQSWRSMKRSIGVLGDTPMGQFLYIGPVQPTLADGDLVLKGEDRFLPRRTETLYLEGRALYIWALLTRCGGTQWTNS